MSSITNFNSCLSHLIIVHHYVIPLLQQIEHLRRKVKNIANKKERQKRMDIEIFRNLHNILNTCNSRYLESFKTVNEYVQQQHLNPDEISIVLDPFQRPSDDVCHSGRFNLPASNAVLLPDEATPLDPKLL